MDTLTGMTWNRRPSRILMITAIAELVLAVGFILAGFLLPGGAVPMIMIGVILALVGIPLLWAGVKARSRYQNAQRLKATGQPATGRIVALRQTGWSMNDQPQVEITMDVHVEGRAPFRVTRKEFVPQMLLGMLTNGAPLSLRVNPQDPEDLVIDWENRGAVPFGAVLGGLPSGLSAAVSGGVAGGLPVGASAGGASAAGAQVIGGTNLPSEEALEANRARLRQVGLDGRATIDAATATGVQLGDNHLLLLTITVTRAGANPYTVSFPGAVPSAHVGRCVPGNTVPVKIDPADPNGLLIEWDAP